jgi:hypothetical protein
MTTTAMRDSIVGDQWIYEMCQLNPPGKVMVNGQWNGNITTGPVRLAFVDSVFEKQPSMKNDPKSRLVHSINCLFPPWADLTVFREEWNRIAAAEWGNLWNGVTFVGLDDPIRNQGEKAHQYSGFTPNCYFINPSSEYAPLVTDIRGNPVVDRTKVYAGVWAIVAVNSYASGKGSPRKGPRFGLQAIMIIADDTNLAKGAAVTHKDVFSGVNVKPPANAIPAGFGAAPPQVPQPGIGVAAFNQPSLPPPPSYAAPAAPEALVGGLTLEQRRAFGLA